MATKTTVKKGTTSKMAVKQTPKKRATKATVKDVSKFSKKSWFFSKKSLIVFVALIGVAGVLFNTFSKAATFELVGDVPGAVTQSTSWGKTIKTMKAYNGKLYFGYGDWNDNTGPIALNPYDPRTNTFAATAEYTADTEAIEIFREFNGKLYAPSTDPKRSADYSVGTKNADGSVSWVMNNSMRMVHVFDIAQGASANELYLAGSKDLGRGKDDAVVYRSLDGGATWQLILQHYNDPTRHARFVTIGYSGGKIYTHGYEFADSGFGTSLPSWKVWNGSSWGNVAAQSTASPYHAGDINGKFVYQSSKFGGGLYTMGSGGKGATLLLSNVRNFTQAADGYIYVLQANSNVIRSKDLSNWENLAVAPAGAMSIEVLDGYLYVAGSEAKLYRAEIAKFGSDTIPPSVSIVTPTNGSTVSGNTVISAAASDNSKISKVLIYIGIGQYATLTEAPYSYTWQTANFADGTYTLKAIAYDDSLNITTSTSITVTVNNGGTSTDTTKPVITSLSPTNGTKIKGKNLTIKAAASDNIKVARMELLLDGQPIATSLSSTIEARYNASELLSGEHQVIVNAYDAAGNVGTRTITIIK